MASMRDDTREAVEEALAVLAARDLVYWDATALQWVCSIPLKTLIRTAFGEVRLLLVRSVDGVLICAPTSDGNRGATAYLMSNTIGVDASGNYVDISLLPNSQGGDGEECEQAVEDESTSIGCGSRGVGSTRTQPRCVDLRGCFLDHSDMVRVSKGIASNGFLTVLSLSGNQLQDGSITLLADALLHNGVLQELILSYNEIGALGSTLLATALADHRSLRILDLMHNRIGRDGVSPWLGRTLRTNAVLQELRLTHNDVGDRKGTELVSALASKPTTVEEQLKTAVRRRTVATAAPTAAVAAAQPAALAMRGIGGAGSFTKDETYNSTLTTLLLGNTGLSHDAARYLRHVLAENTTLTRLDLSSNCFGDLDHQNIAVGLKGNRALRYFNYNENRVDQEAAVVALLCALRVHATLETALFQDCFHGSNAATALAEWLRSTSSLTTIDLSHCRLEPPGVVDFYRAIGDNRSLRNLEMTCMGIKSDQAVAVLGKSVAAHAGLRFLNVSYNEITLRGCKALRDAAAGRPTLLLSLEGNSGEKQHPGVHITGGSKPARPILRPPMLD